MQTLDKMFWEKSYTFHSMTEDEVPSSTRGSNQPEYITKHWVPTFLQPVLQEVVMTGKSMEMLEGLGKLAQQNDGPNNTDPLKG